MNRTIKFRGLCRISKEWIFGDLIHGVSHKSGRLFILPNKQNLAYVKHCDPLDGVDVIPNTVGQFIDLTDKNRKDIYEGDVARLGSGAVVEIKFKDGGFGYNSPHDSDDFIGFSDHNHLSSVFSRLEIIGNIYEHPELLQP